MPNQVLAGPQPPPTSLILSPFLRSAPTKRPTGTSSVPTCPPSCPHTIPVSSLRGCTQEACPRPACGWFLLHTPHPQEKLASPVSHPVLDELQAKGQVRVTFTRGRVRDLLTLGTNKRFSQATTLLKWAFLFQYRFQTGLQDA